MKTLIFLASLLVLATFIQTSEGIKCYVCSGSGSSACADEDDLTESMTSGGCTVCGKVRAEDDNGNVWYTRSCHGASHENGCDEESSGDGSVKVCYCDEDKCNTASHMGVSFGGLFTLLVARRLF